MKKLRFLKRVVAMLLVLIMGTSGALQTVSVYAAETVNAQVEGANDSGDSQEGDLAGDVEVDGNMPSGSTSEDGVSLDDNMTVTGTNGFGNLLADALSTETKEQAQNNGYNVFSIDMSGNTATVDMEVLGDCTLIVALYDNDGKVMLTSNATEVTKDTREATVQLEATKIPQYYYLRAFLVDSITYQPMCTMYESTLYTEAMQAFLAKTTDDFDQDKVLNLDDDKTNNFAVFSAATKLIPTVDGVNNLVSVDDATGTYTFENVDSNITSLVAGDIFAYEYNGELYIVKVASISVSGTTATIVEGETSMEDVFEYVKIDTVSGLEDAIVDDSTCSEGVTYVGLVDADEVEEVGEVEAESQSENGTDDLVKLETEITDVYAVQNEVSAKEQLKIEFDGKEFECEWDDGTKFTCKLRGAIVTSMTGVLKYYIAADVCFLEVYLDYKFGFSIGFEGKFNSTVKLAEIAFMPIPGITIKVVPEFGLKATVTASFDGDLHGKAGISVSSENGMKNLTTVPKIEAGIQVSGTIYIALFLKPQINIVCDKVAKISLEFSGGVNITGKMKYPFMDSRTKHECRFCVSGDVSSKFTLGYNVEFLNMKRLTFNDTFLCLEHKLFDYSFCLDEMLFCKGSCPHYTYRVDVYVSDKYTHKVLPNMKVTVRNSGYYNEGYTDTNGKISIFLPLGKYSLCALKGDSIKLGKTLNVTKDTTMEVMEVDLGNSSSGSETGGEDIGIGDEEDPPEDDMDDEIPTEPYSEFQYMRKSDGTLEIVSWRGTATNLTIPSNVNGRKITSIGDKAFYDKDGLVSVYIPETIVNIGDYAFSECDKLSVVKLTNGLESMEYGVFNNCVSLKEINIPNTLHKVGYVAPFKGCVKLENIIFDSDISEIIESLFENCLGLKRVVIPQTVTKIGASSFSGCTNLVSIEIPDSVDYIGNYAFSGCESIESINIPSALKEINMGVFGGCESLVSVVIEENVESISTVAFQGCTNLKSVSFPDSLREIGIETFADCIALTDVKLNQGLTTINKNAFDGCTSITSINIPNTLVTAGEFDDNDGGYVEDGICNRGAFIRCSNLKNITFENNITRIPDYLFAGCDGIENVVIPTTVKEMGWAVFADCSNLKKVILPEGLSSIVCDTFYRCKKLETIVIPSSVNNIDEYAFYGCELLKEVILPDNVECVGASAFSNCVALEKLVLNNGLKSLGASAFRACVGLTSVHIPNTIKMAGSYNSNLGAFSGCDNLKLVTFEEGMTGIPYRLFNGCSGLTSIDIPETVTYIGACAFENCSGLREINIGANVKHIYSHAFKGCTGLQKVNISPGLEYLGEGAFEGCSLLSSIILPSTLNEYSTSTQHNGAFVGCSNLKTVTFEEGTTVIAEALFNSCDGLEQINLPSTIISIGDYAFYKCNNLKKLELPDNVKNVGEQAFYKCVMLETVVLNNGLESIGSYAFAGCVALTSVNIPATLIEAKSAFSGSSSLVNITLSEGITNIPDKLFYNCDGLTEISIPGTVKKVGEYAFAYCDSLEKVVLNNGVEVLDKGAFNGNIKLSTVYIPATLKSVKAYSIYNMADKTTTYIYVFGGCTSLKEVIFEEGMTEIPANVLIEGNSIEKLVLPASLKRIGDRAFYNCTSLIEVYIPQGIEAIGDYAFYNCSSLIQADLPDGMKTIGKGAYEKCSLLRDIVLPDSLIEIGKDAFLDCTSLNSVTLNNGLEKIGDGAFENTAITSIHIPKTLVSAGSHSMFVYGAIGGCEKLETVTFDIGIERVPVALFKGCKKLPQFTIPDTVTTIGACAFAECLSLETISLPQSVTSIGSDAFAYCYNLREVELPSGVTYIGDSAFRNSGIRSIVIPAVKTMGYQAFYNCVSLSEVTLSDGIEELGFEVFRNCISLTSIRIPSSLVNYELNKGAPYVAGAFYECSNLKNVTFGEGTTTIDEGLLANCSGIEEITIPSTVISVGAQAFSYCNNLIKVTAYCDSSVLADETIFTGCNSSLEIIFATADDSTNTDDTTQDDGNIEATETENSTASESTTVSDMPYSTQLDVNSGVNVELVCDEVSTPNETTQPNTALAPIPATQAPQLTSIDLTSNSVTYTDLVPGQMYNFYIFKSEKADNIFADGNLVYVAQVTADENGSVTIAYTLDDIYYDVVLKLVSDGKVNIADANISEVTGWKYEGYEMPPYIGITYNGKALVQGRDYHLSGDVVADGMGIYNITVSGDGAFTGEKSFRYIVTGDCVFGDGNGDNVVDIRDAVQLKQRIAGMDVDMNTYAADVNADTEIDIKDAVKLMKYMAGFEDVVLGEAS